MSWELLVGAGLHDPGVFSREELPLFTGNHLFLSFTTMVNCLDPLGLMNHQR
jgi:hypothetical protein